MQEGAIGQGAYATPPRVLDGYFLLYTQEALSGLEDIVCGCLDGSHSLHATSWYEFCCMVGVE